MNAGTLVAATGAAIDGLEAPQRITADVGEHPMTWAFHFDDEPADIVTADMSAGAGGGRHGRALCRSQPVDGAVRVQEFDR